MKTTLTVKGTHCESCKAMIEDVCSETVGIKSATANFKTGKVEIEHDGTVDWQKFKQEIESLGEYEVVLEQ